MVRMNGNCQYCGKQFDSRKAVKAHIGRVHQDQIKERLKELYLRQNLSSSEVGEKMDLATSTVSRWVTKLGLRDKDPANYYFNPGGEKSYPRWVGTGCNGRSNRLRVHQLLAIADGADPHKIFSGNWDVDHINGCPFDNRPENLRVMPKGKHGAKDGSKSEFGHSREDMLYLMQFAFNARPFLEVAESD